MRLADPDQHTEALTRRPLLLYGVGRQTRHAHQTTIITTRTPGKADHRTLAEVAAVFTALRKTAERSIAGTGPQPGLGQPPQGPATRTPPAALPA